MKKLHLSDRDRNILEAAYRVFAQFGVKKTSMADIAEAAGVSRQTLYKSFRSKDDVLRAHIRAYTDDAIDQITEGLADTDGLGPRLDLIFEKMTVVGFDMVRSAPNAQDLEAGFGEASQAELEATAQDFQAVIAGVLEPYAPALTAAGMTVDGLADFIQRSASAAKNYANDKPHLLQQLATLKHLCLRAAQSETD